MLTSKKQVMEMAKDLGITLDGLKYMPEFGLCPTRVQIAPEKYIPVSGRFYTMATLDEGKTWTPIKEVSEQYALVQHWEALGALLEGIESKLDAFGKPDINLQFSANGARMFNDVRWKDMPIIVNGDKIIPILRQENSVDLSRRFLSQFRAERLVCSNGMTVPDNRFPNKESVRKLHKKGTLDLQDALQITMENMDSFADTIQLWDGWKNKNITPLEMTEVLEKVGISEKQSEALITAPLRGFHGTLGDQFGNGKKADLWTAYNAVTQWVTDSTENPATESERSRKASDEFEIIALR